MKILTHVLSFPDSNKISVLKMYCGFDHVNNLILFVFLNLLYKAKLQHKRHQPKKATKKQP